MNSIDYEFVKNKNYEGLWKKYKGLCIKFYLKLPEDIRKIEYDSFDDFYVDCFEVLKEAVDKLKLSKIKNSETWTFYQQFFYYLHNFTTRDIVRETYKRLYNEKPTDFYSTILDDYEERNTDFMVEYNFELPILMNSLTEEEEKIVTLRLAKRSWADVKKALGYTAPQLKEAISSLREKITKYI